MKTLGLEHQSSFKLDLHKGVSVRKTARQSCLFNVGVGAGAAAVHCEVVRIEAGPIARRAKMSCRTKASSDQPLASTRCLVVFYCFTSN